MVKLFNYFSKHHVFKQNLLNRQVNIDLSRELPKF